MRGLAGSIDINVDKVGYNFAFNPSSGFDMAALVMGPIIVVLWLGLAFSHALLFRHKFAMHYLQVTLPLLGVLWFSWLSYFFPALSFWLNILVNVCEGYIVCGFGALLLGLLQFEGEDPYDVIENDGYATRCCAFANMRLRCGPEVSAVASLHWIKWQCIQFWIAAPLLALLGALTTQMDAGGQLATLIFSILRAISIIVALKGLWTLYHSVMHKLKAHRPFMKFTAIKLIFLAIILNTLVLGRIVDTPAMPVPDGICPETWRQDNMGACNVRYVYFIQIIEALGIFLIVLYFYSPAEFMNEAPGAHGRGESVDVMNEEDAVRDRSLCGRCCYVLLNAFAFWQVLVYWDIEPSKERLAKHSQVELGLAFKTLGGGSIVGEAQSSNNNLGSNASTRNGNEGSAGSDTLSGNSSGKAKSDVDNPSPAVVAMRVGSNTSDISSVRR